MLFRSGGRIAGKWGAKAGAAYLLRPDLHVAARWPKVSADRFTTALAVACSNASPEAAR